MQDLLIKVENDQVKYAVGLFFDNYKDAVAKFVNNVLTTETGASDCFVTKGKDNVWEVYQNAPDKGYVLAQVGGIRSLPDGTQIDTVEVCLTTYKTLPQDTKYIVTDGDKLALFIKTEEGKPDLKVGHFLNINEAVTQIDSESVKLAIDTVKSGVRNAISNAIVDKKKADKRERRSNKQDKA